MSIADHFEYRSDAGFVRVYDARSARRQFQVSAALVIVLALSAFALGFLARSDQGFRPAANALSAKVSAFSNSQTLLDKLGG